MKIIDVKLHPVGSRRVTGEMCAHVIIRLMTDEGIEGIGEMSDVMHGKMLPDVDFLENSIRKSLVGADPFDPTRTDPAVDQVPFPYSAGVDSAIHDLRARILDVPLHDLFGGRYRDRYRVCYPIYRHTGMSQVDGNIERVGEALKQGFDLIRVYVGGNLDADERFLRTLRETYGDRVAVEALDFSRSLTWREAIRAIERLAFVEPMLVESPCPDLTGKARVRAAVEIPISEHCLDEEQAVTFAQAGAVDVLTLGVNQRGIRRGRQLFIVAEAFGLKTLVGSTQELSLGTCAQLHLAASVPNLHFPGYMAGPAIYEEDVVVERPRYEDGHIIVPEGPGLGLELNPEKLERMTDRTWEFMQREWAS